MKQTEPKQPNQGKTSAAIYARTSVDDINDPRLSTSAQVQSCLERAKTEFLTVEQKHIYIELDTSATKPPTRWQSARLTQKNHRPELEKLMRAIEAGEVRTVIIRKDDRLWRNVKTGIALIEFLIANKINVICLDGNLPMDGSATGNLQLHLALAVAQYVAETTSENVKRSKAKALAEGLKMGPVFTLGFKDGGKKGQVEIDNDLIPIVHEVYSRYVNGQSILGIANWLNTEHLEKYNNYGKQFYASNVNRILSNVHYIGKAFNAEGKLIDSPIYSPIISNELFSRVQQLRKARKNEKHGKRIVKQHLLSGFLTCAHCGRPLTIYSRYSKVTHERTGFEFKCKYQDCKPTTASVQEMFWDDWADMVFGQLEISLNDSAPISGDMVSCQSKVDKLQANLQKLKDAFSNGEIELSEYQELSRNLKGSISKAQGEIDSLKSKEIKDRLADWKPWKKLTIDEKRERMFEIVEYIRVFENGVELKLKFNSGTGIGTAIDFALAHLTVGDSAIWFPIVKRHIEEKPSVRRFHTLTPVDWARAMVGYSMFPDGRLTPDYLTAD